MVLALALLVSKTQADALALPWRVIYVRSTSPRYRSIRAHIYQQKAHHKVFAAGFWRLGFLSDGKNLSGGEGVNLFYSN